MFSTNRTADSLRKCELHDNACLAQTFTYLAQHSEGKLNEWNSFISNLLWYFWSLFSTLYVCIQLELPQLGLPDFNPFKSSQQCVFKPLKATILAAQVYWSNITLHGIDQMVVQEIRYIVEWCTRNQCMLESICDNFTFCLVVFSQINPHLKLNWECLYQECNLMRIQIGIQKSFRYPLEWMDEKLCTWVCRLRYDICQRFQNTKNVN